jgi:hypothetical protein
MKWRVLNTPRSSFSPQTSGNRREIPDTGVSYASVTQRVCRQFVAGPLPHLLLAMQKVEGSNPISRFGRPAICGSLSLDQSGSASASGRTDSGLAGEASVARLQESAGLQAILVGSNRRASAGCTERQTFCLLRPLAGSSCNYAFSRADACRAGYHRSGSAAPVRFQVRKPRGKPRPAPKSHRRLSCSLRCQSSSPRNARFGSRADTLRDHARAGARSSG